MTPFRESARAAPPAPLDVSERARTTSGAIAVVLGLVALVYFAPIFPFMSSHESLASLSTLDHEATLATMPQFAAALLLMAVSLVARIRGDAPSGALVGVGAVLAAIPGAQLAWCAVALVPHLLTEYLRADPGWKVSLALLLAAAAGAIVVLVRALVWSRGRGWIRWRRLLAIFSVGMGVQALLLVSALTADASGAAWLALIACLGLTAIVALP